MVIAWNREEEDDKTSIDMRLKKKKKKKKKKNTPKCYKPKSQNPKKQRIKMATSYFFFSFDVWDIPFEQGFWLMSLISTERINLWHLREKCSPTKEKEMALIQMASYESMIYRQGQDGRIWGCLEGNLGLCKQLQRTWLQQETVQVQLLPITSVLSFHHCFSLSTKGNKGASDLNVIVSAISVIVGKKKKKSIDWIEKKGSVLVLGVLVLH